MDYKAKKIPYLCSMEIMIKKFCKKYKLPEKSLLALLSHMTEVQYAKGELIIREGNRNSNFYLLKKETWRAYYLKSALRPIYRDGKLWRMFLGTDFTDYTELRHYKATPLQRHETVKSVKSVPKIL